MSSVNVSDLASLIANDGTLLLEWEFLYKALRLDLDKKERLRAELEKNGNVFSLIYAIIEQFAVENGAKATTTNLAEALEEVKRFDLKEKMLEVFDINAVISAPVVPLGYVMSHKEQAVKRHDCPELQAKTLASGISILQLMSPEEEGKSRLAIFVSHLLSILAKVGDNPVAIVSINGKQRAGKSFLATQFIKYLSRRDQPNWLDEEMDRSFLWRDDFDRVTSGIQVWHEPLDVEYNGKKIYVIVLDTQGLQDNQTSTSENAAIFGLSALLSSVFIYNEKHAADDSLQYLRALLEHTKFTGGNDIKFQKLVLLMRDWQNEARFPFGYYDDVSLPDGCAGNLKKKFFEVTPDTHPEAGETRRAIQNCYEDIAVYAMARPGEKFPDKAEPILWEEDFRKGILGFVSKIFFPKNLALNTKKILGEEATGNDLIPFVSQCAKLILEADGSVKLKTVFDSTAELFFLKKIAKFVEKYEGEMSKFLEANPTGVNETEFARTHRQLLEQLSVEFTIEKGFGGDQLKETYKKKFTKDAEKRMTTFQSTNKSNLDKEKERQRLEAERAAALAREAAIKRQAEAAAKAHQAELARIQKEKEENERKHREEMERLERERVLASMPRPIIRQDNNVTIYQNHDGTIDVNIRGSFTWDQNFVNSLGGAQVRNIQIG